MRSMRPKNRPDWPYSNTSRCSIILHDVTALWAMSVRLNMNGVITQEQLTPMDEAA